MYAIVGISGRVGGMAAKLLKAQGAAVRGIFRDSAKAEAWQGQGGEARVLELRDVAALTSAFDGVQGAFVMVPPNFAPAPGFPDAQADIDAIIAALRSASVPHIVALSSVGSQHREGLGLITQTRMLEDALGILNVPSTILRPAWFMENSASDIARARETGELDCYLAPLDRPFPMVATTDIGLLAAQSLLQGAASAGVIELEGPRRYSQRDIADLFTSVLGRQVRARAIERSQWPGKLGPVDQGFQPHIEMLDGFNSGHIDFEGTKHRHAIGKTPFAEVLQGLAA
jgi:NAD(P)H dehydrogenase (quinone)